MKLTPGIYENIITRELETELENLENLEVQKTPYEKDETSLMLSKYIAKLLEQKFEDSNCSVEEKVDQANRIIKTFSDSKQDLIVDRSNILSEITTVQTKAIQIATKKETARPQTGFLYSSLFTGRNSKIPLYSEIKKDITSADTILFIVSFLRLSGLNLIFDDLKKFCENPNHKLKIITTTYCGITELKAVKRLAELENTEIKISYNLNKECLHAKSYIFMRNSGCHTAYIGSSNLSKSAQTTGLEWNIRVTNSENPQIINAAKATFDSYWNNQDFETFRIGDEEKFRSLTNKSKISDNIALESFQQYKDIPYQQTILEKIEVERKENNNYKNLIVAATGTGKTVISAIDYKKYCAANKSHKLLFIAHRKEILEQAIRTYRGILIDANFGDLWVGNYKPDSNLDHLFISIEMFNSQFRSIFSKLPEDYYDYIVIDEAHHSVAKSYRQIFDHFKPKVLLGLTATPERMDGTSLLPDFGGKITAEIRLPEALENGILTPFQYYCISDDTDLTEESIWRGGKYIDTELAKRLCTNQRTALIVKTLQFYLAEETNVKALCFCVNKEHAKYTSEQLTKAGFNSDYLFSGSNSDSPEKRKETINKLRRGEINYLCVVDIFNEGIDIPEIDTILFLRPTESLTIFLQQLGRGLRTCIGKTYLTVFDFVAQVNNKFDFESRFRALLKKTVKGIDVRKQIIDGFVLLPSGCSIVMEEKAKSFVLQRISSAIFNTKRIVKKLQDYTIAPTLSEFFEDIDEDISILYKGNHCWTSLKRDAGLVSYTDDDFTSIMSQSINKLLHINSASYLRFIKKTMNMLDLVTCENETEKRFLTILYYTLFYKKTNKIDNEESPFNTLKKLRSYPLFIQEIKELVDYKLANLEIVTESFVAENNTTLEVYSSYYRNEILALFGYERAMKALSIQYQTGIVPVGNNTELFFVTLNKSEKDFSPTSMYKDYVISEKKFHWQSQNRDTIKGSGSRYINQKNNGKKFILFVRETTDTPFYCFGYINYISSYGEKPMNIEWEVEKPIMAKFLTAV